VGLLHEKKRMGMQGKIRPVLDDGPGLALYPLPLLVPGETPKRRERSDRN
jgi:hypothetical protein